MNHRFFVFAFTFLSLLFFLSRSVKAETAELDLAAGTLRVVPRDETRTPILPEVLPPAAQSPEVKGLKFDWNTSCTNSYIEMAFRKVISLPAFGEAKVHARFWAPTGCSVRGFNVRFRDAEGEILQFPAEANFVQGGFFDVNWTIRPDGASGSWGVEKPNKIVNMPAIMHSMVVSFHDSMPSGVVYLLGLTVETFAPISDVEREAATVNAARPVVPDDGSAFYRKPNGWGKSDFEFRDGKIFLSNVTTGGGFVEHKLHTTRWENKPVKLVFETELLEGRAALGAVFCYADEAQKGLKDRFVTPMAELPQGRGTVEIDLTETLAPAQYPVRPTHFQIEPLKNKEFPESPGGTERFSRGGLPHGIPRFIIHSIKLVQRQPAPEAVDFDVETGNPIHVLKIGEESSLRFRFTNRGDRDGDFTFRMEYANYFGQTRTETLSASLKAGECKTLEPDWRPDSLGHWDLRATVSEAKSAGITAVKERSIAYFKPSGPTPRLGDGEFLFSVCTHTERWGEVDRDREVLASALCGIKVSRLGIGWAGVEPKKGVWDFTRTDELVEKYAKVGIEPQFILSSTPTWALPEVLRNDPTIQGWRFRCENLDDWKNYVRTVATRYWGKARFYENWNEPDLLGFSQMNLGEYVSLQKAAREALREVDPKLVCMSGGFATLGRHAGLIYPEFQRDFLAEAKGSFDVHAFHAHGWFGGYREQIDDRFMPIRRETGTDSVPWYSNETAMTSVGNQRARQAQNLFKKLTFAWARGSIGYTWYDLRDDGYDPAYGEHHFGMVTNDFYPKSVYSVYNMLTANYSGMKSARDVSPDRTACVYAFTGGKTILLAGWTESSLKETRHLVVRTDAKSARLVDLMGNETPVEIREGHAVFEITPTPATLKLEDVTVAEPVGELVKATASGDCVPGRVTELALSVLNPLTVGADFVLQPLPIRGLSYLTEPQTVHCEPLGSGKLTLKMEVGPEFTAPAILPVLYKLPGTNWSGIVYLPLKPAYWLEKEWKADAPSNPVLNQRTPLTPADPANAHRLWKGPEDLKARCEVAASAEALKVRFVVQDDEPTAGDYASVFVLIPGKADSFREIRNAEPPKREGTQKGTQAVYEFMIPWKELGITPAELKKDGIHLDFLVGDDDGEGLDTLLHTRREPPKAENMQEAERGLMNYEL